MKDGRTDLAHQVEHAVNMKTGAVLAVTVQGADQGDTTTIQETTTEAARQLDRLASDLFLSLRALCTLPEPLLRFDNDEAQQTGAGSNKVHFQVIAYSSTNKTF